jgi:hypothetical protein
MNIYFFQDRQEHKRLSGIPWNSLILNKILNINCLCSTGQICQMTKRSLYTKNIAYCQLLAEIVESDTINQCHGSLWICWFYLQQGHHPKHNFFSLAFTHNDRSINTIQAGLKLLRPQISQQHPSRICFKTLGSGCHITFNLNLLSLKMVEGENSMFMCEIYGIQPKPATSHNKQM